jgi:hypothetical protein
MKKRCFDCRPVVPETALDPACNDHCVVLIGGALRPEDLGARLAEVITNELLVMGPRRLRAQVTEEPLDQVRRLPKSQFHDNDLHLMHNRDVGR